MEKTKKSSKVSIIVRCIIGVVSLAFMVVVLAGPSIFPKDFILANVFNDEIPLTVPVRLLRVVFVAAATYVAIQLASLLGKSSEKVKNNGTKTIVLLLANILKYVAFIAAIFIILSACGVDTTAIVTGAGVLTLIIGLGCQSLVSDIVAGIFMLFEGDIQVGDIVVVNGWRGTVIQIGLRRTKIMDAVGNVNIINNSSISNIINNTRELSIAAIDVGIEYNESIQKVESIIEDSIPQIRKEIPAIVEGPFYKGVSSLGDSAVTIKLVAKCNETDKYQVERDMNRAIKIIFDEYGINIPFNQVVVNYRDPNEADKTQDSTYTKKADLFVKKQNKLSRGVEDTSNK